MGWLLAVLAGGAILLWHPRAPLLMPDPTAIERAALPPGALLVDLRTEEEFLSGHAPDALSIPPGDWEAGFDQLLMRWDGHQAIVFYCEGGSCDRSAERARWLREELGFESVFFLRGGWAELREVEP